MRKAKRFIPLLLLLALLLSSCGAAQELDREALGWKEDWDAVGYAAAAEPLEGFKLSEMQDIMPGYWIATWTCGEGKEIKNDQGEDAVLFDAKIYLLIRECDNAGKAAAEIDTWQELERKSYDLSEPSQETHAGVSYRVMAVTPTGDNPYSGGIIALAAIGRYAVSVELMAQEDAPITPRVTLDAFLDGLHFNLEEA